MKRIQIVAAGMFSAALAACGPVAPPVVVAPAPTVATLAVVVKSDQGIDIAGADCKVHTGETGTTNDSGYVNWLLSAGEHRDRHVDCAASGYEPNGIDFSPFLRDQQQTIVLRAIPPPVAEAPSFASTARPLVGPLRVQDKLFRDDTGYRRIFFNSWFTALRTLRDNPPEFYRQLDAIAAANYQGVRVFLAVGGWMDYWDGHEVAPVTFKKWHFNRENGGHLDDDRSRPGRGVVIEAWPDFDPLYRTMIRAFKARKLRFDFAFGDMQMIVGNDQAKELELHRRLSRIAAEEGGLEVVALVEGTNEVPLNRYGGDGAASIEQLGRILAIWRQAIPGVLTTQGAFLSEEPDRLYASVTYGQVAAVHVTRDPIVNAIKRTAGLVFWEGNWRAFPVPFWHTEPAGPGKDSYAAQNDPANLTALYSMQSLTGAASNYFNGPAVRGDGPLESTWGFKELPKILSVLPENVATWTHDSNRRGGIMYWFQGTTFASVTYKDWDPSPPRPIADWTLYAGDQVTQGTGTPPSKITGLLVGHFQ